MASPFNTNFSGPVTLAPGASMTVDVDFTCTTIGAVNGTLNFTGTVDGAPFTFLTVALSANCDEACMDSTFTSNGTFTIPAGVNSIEIIAKGGGGGGGGAGANAFVGGNNAGELWRSQSGFGGPGAPGAMMSDTFSVTPGETLTVTVGGGGRGGGLGQHAVTGSGIGSGGAAGSGDPSNSGASTDTSSGASTDTPIIYSGGGGGGSGGASSVTSAGGTIITSALGGNGGGGGAGAIPIRSRLLFRSSGDGIASGVGAVANATDIPRTTDGESGFGGGAGAKYVNPFYARPEFIINGDGLGGDGGDGGDGSQDAVGGGGTGGRGGLGRYRPTSGHDGSAGSVMIKCRNSDG